jgi:hypothetical protein
MAALAAVFLSAGAVQTAQADAEVLEKGLYTFGAPEIEAVTEAQAPQGYAEFIGLRPNGSVASSATADDGVAGDFNVANVILDQIINMGKKVWAIIEANKPVVNVSTDTANALPEGVRGWQNLQGWQSPFSRLYHVSYKNVWGMKVVDLTYRVLFTYGGNVSGKGRYLANVTVVPSDLYVFWGYTFSLQASVPSVLNAGTSADPVASAQLLLNWKIDTALNHQQNSQSYNVKGDGTFTDLSNGS